MRHAKLALSYVLGTAWALAACAGPTTVEVSGRVVVAGSDAPLANHEVEVLVTTAPWIPLGTPSYVKQASGWTDENGHFSFSVTIPKHRRFALQTTNGDHLPGSFVKLSPDGPTNNLKLIHSIH
jgi:hypothetical protein